MLQNKNWRVQPAQGVPSLNLRVSGNTKTGNDLWLGRRIMKKPSSHPWRVTLMWAHKGLLTGALPPVEKRHLFLECPVTSWSALSDDSAGPDTSNTGERVWGRYCIGSDGPPPWWEAVFADTGVRIRGARLDGYFIPVPRTCAVLPFPERMHRRGFTKATSIASATTRPI